MFRLKKYMGIFSFDCESTSQWCIIMPFREFHFANSIWASFLWLFSVFFLVCNKSRCSMIEEVFVSSSIFRTMEGPFRVQFQVLCD